MSDLSKTPSTVSGKGGYAYDFAPRDNRNALVRRKKDKVIVGQSQFTWEEIQTAVSGLVDGTS